MAKGEFFITPAGNIGCSGGEWRELFARGNGPGLLAMLRGDAPELPAGAAAEFLRGRACDFAERIGRASGFSRIDDDRTFLEALRPEAGELDAVLQQAPPFTGGDYLSGGVLARWHRELELEALAGMARLQANPVDWLRALNPVWNEVGKIVLHLAENRKDPDGSRPFAFLATFVHRLNLRDEPRHLPLGTALATYADDKATLLTLLTPLERAARDIPLIARLLESKRIFKAELWNAADAYEFLQAIPQLEALHIPVRITNLWKKIPPKLSVAVEIDAASPGRMGAHSLLRFSVGAALGGEKLSQEELDGLLTGAGGLLRVKGQWVTAEPEKVAMLLARWRQAEKLQSERGLPLVAGLRLLAGAGRGRLLPPGLPEGEAEVTAGESVRRFLAGGDAPPMPELPSRLAAMLRPYQLEGVKWLWKLGELGLGGCLADDMGLGKSIQTLGWLELLRSAGVLKDFPALLVVPASLLENWRAEAARFAPELKFGILHASAVGRGEWEADPAAWFRQFEVVATTYHMVTRLEFLQEMIFPAVIADEAQAIKNAESNQSRRLRRLRGARRFALTGTPVENSLNDLWSIFDFAVPGLLGEAPRFREYVRESGDYAALRRLTRPFILRRLKSDRSIIADLPDKSEMPCYCRLTPLQAALYARTVRAMAQELENAGDDRRPGVVLGYLSQFKQICNHPANYDGSGHFPPEASGKFERLGELVSEIVLRHEKVLVFTQFREMIEPLHDYLATFFGRSGLMLHGGTPVGTRSELVREFQREAGAPFFVLSLRAAGTGLNLTRADHVIHFDRWWNPAVENQATDRAYRIGRHRNVLVHKFITVGTIESKIDAMINAKAGLARDLFSNEPGNPLLEMDNRALLELVRMEEL